MLQGNAGISHYHTNASDQQGVGVAMRTVLLRLCLVPKSQTKHRSLASAPPFLGV